MFRDISFGIIFTCYRRSISSKMLRTSKHSVSIIIIGTLKTFYTSLCHLTTIPRVFTGSFHRTPPTGIPGDINHGSKRPVNPMGRSLRRRHTGCFFYQFQIKTGSFSHRYRENSPHPMYNIQTKNQRNPQTGLHSQILILPCTLYSQYIKNRTYLTTFDFFRMITTVKRRSGQKLIIGILNHLPDFFFQSHKIQYRIYLMGIILLPCLSRQGSCHNP